MRIELRAWPGHGGKRTPRPARRAIGPGPAERLSAARSRSRSRCATAPRRAVGAEERRAGDWLFRPSPPSVQPTTTQRSPARTGPSSRAASSPSSMGVPPAATMGAHPLGQSSAAQRNSGRTVAAAVDERGIRNPGRRHQVSPGAPAPGKIRRPSPAARSGPHAKQRGNAWSRKPGYPRAAASASANPTGGGHGDLDHGRRARRDDGVAVDDRHALAVPPDHERDGRAEAAGAGARARARRGDPRPVRRRSRRDPSPAGR